jgi:hypothetical protein
MISGARLHHVFLHPKGHLRNRIFIWTGGIGVLCVSVAALMVYDGYDISDVEHCFSIRTKDRNMCLTRVVTTMLGNKNSREFMREVESALPLGRCHDVAHIVGKHLYTTLGKVDDVLSECSSSCRSGCLHGYLGEMLKETISPQVIDGAHIDLGSLTREGKTLCKESEPCHALGHVAFSSLSSLAEALKFCDNDMFGRNALHCYLGAYMEHFTPFSTLSSTLHRDDDPAVSFHVDDLLWPCRDSPSRYQTACYHYLYMQQQAVFDLQGVHDKYVRARMRIDACNTLDAGEARDWCFEGFGASMAGNISIKEAREYCESLTHVSESALCAVGYVFYRPIVYGPASPGALFCASFSEADIKRACYKSLFSVLNRIVKDGALNRGCEGNLDDMCVQSLHEYRMNSSL